MIGEREAKEGIYLTIVDKDYRLLTTFATKGADTRPLFQRPTSKKNLTAEQQEIEVEFSLHVHKKCQTLPGIFQAKIVLADLRRRLGRTP